MDNEPIGDHAKTDAVQIADAAVSQRRIFDADRLRATRGLDGVTLAELEAMENSDDPAVRAKAQAIVKTTMAPIIEHLENQSAQMGEAIAKSPAMQSVIRNHEAMATAVSTSALRGLGDWQGKTGMKMEDSIAAGFDDLAKISIPAAVLKDIDALQLKVGGLLKGNPSLLKAATDVAVPHVAMPMPNYASLTMPALPTHAADTAAATQEIAETLGVLVEVARAQHDLTGMMIERQDADAATQTKRFRIMLPLAVIAAVGAIASVVVLF